MREGENKWGELIAGPQEVVPNAVLALPRRFDVGVGQEDYVIFLVQQGLAEGCSKWHESKE